MAWNVPPQTRSCRRRGRGRRGRRRRWLRRRRLGAAGRGRLGKQGVDAPQHLGGGAAGEREQQDAPRVGAAGDQVRHAVHQRRGLAGARAGDDEQRAVAVRGGGELLGIEVGEHGRTPVRYRRAAP